MSNNRVDEIDGEPGNGQPGKRLSTTTRFRPRSRPRPRLRSRPRSRPRSRSKSRPKSRPTSRPRSRPNRHTFFTPYLFRVAEGQESGGGCEAACRGGLPSPRRAHRTVAPLPAKNISSLFSASIGSVIIQVRNQS